MATRHKIVAHELRAKVRRQLLGAMELTGVTQAELSRRLDIEPASISTLLSGKDGGRNLELDSLAKLAKALGGEWHITLAVGAKHIKETVE